MGWREDPKSYPIKAKAFYLGLVNEQRRRAVVRHAHGSLRHRLSGVSNFPLRAPL